MHFFLCFFCIVKIEIFYQVMLKKNLRLPYTNVIKYLHSETAITTYTAILVDNLIFAMVLLSKQSL